MEEEIPRTKGESLLPPATVNNSSTATSKGESLFKFDDVLPLDDLNEDCFGSNNNTTKLLLGAHSLEEIKRYMDEYKIGKSLKEQGINEYYMELDTTDWYIHKLFVWMGQKDVTPKDENHLLAEMWFRRVQNIHQVRGVADVAYTDHRAESKRRTHSSVTHISPRTEDEIPEIYHSHDNYLLVNASTLLKKSFLALNQIDFIVIEWTRMQNPTISPYYYHNDIKHELINVDPATLNSPLANPTTTSTTTTTNTNTTTNSNNTTITPENSNTTPTNTTVAANNSINNANNPNNPNNPNYEYKDPFLLLPGQNYPSLGIGRIIDKVLFRLAINGKRDGILNVPLYFHNAVFYQKENYHFVNPVFEGIYETMYRDLLPYIKKRGLGYVAHGLLRGLVKAWVTFEYVEVICKEEEEDETKTNGNDENEGNRLRDTSTSPNPDGGVVVEEGVGEEEDVKSIRSEFESGDESPPSPKLSQKKIIYQLPKKNNRPYATVRWKGLDMMYPISQTMKNFYNGKNYAKLKEEFTGSGVFWIDSENTGLLTEEDWQMAVYCNDVDTREASQAKYKAMEENKN